MLRLRFTQRALRRLELIGEYLYAESPAYASHVMMQLHVATNALAEQPLIGRVGRLTGSRELVLAEISYIIAYEVHENELIVLSFFHTSRHNPID